MPPMLWLSRLGSQENQQHYVSFGLGAPECAPAKPAPAVAAVADALSGLNLFAHAVAVARAAANAAGTQ